MCFNGCRRVLTGFVRVKHASFWGSSGLKVQGLWISALAFGAWAQPANFGFRVWGTLERPS